MEKQGTKVVPIANANDKRQLTVVLAVIASGKYSIFIQREDNKMPPHYDISVRVGHLA